MSDYIPKPGHKFTFGLWTVGNFGRDPWIGQTGINQVPVPATVRTFEHALIFCPCVEH